MNLTDFRDNALLKLQVGGPFSSGMMMDINSQQEFVLIQVEQTEEAGPRRRRSQQVRKCHHLREEPLSCV